MTKELVERAKGWAMIAFLVSVPLFCPATTKDLRIVQEQYFQSAVMAMAALYIGNVWITLFIWLNFGLFVLNGCQVGASQILNIFLTSVLFSCSRSFFAKNSALKYAQALYLVAALTTAWMIFQVFRIDPVFLIKTASGEVRLHDSLSQLCGLMALPPFNGMFLTMASAFLMFTNPIVGLLLIIPILFSKSSGAILGLGFVLALWAKYKKFTNLRLVHAHQNVRNVVNFLLIPVNFVLRRFFCFFMVLMAVSFCLFTMHDQRVDSLTYKSRFENWHHIFKYSLAKPLGWGPDTFRNFGGRKNFIFCSDEDYNPILRLRISENQDVLDYHSADNSKKMERFGGKTPKGFSFWQEAHNEWLQFFFEYGFFGLLLLGLFIKELYDRFVLSEKTKEILALVACFGALGFFSLTQFPFHLARISGIFGVLLGAYFAATDKAYNLVKERYT